MSSIDERVVQMKFDNGQFKKGVAETNQSLETLKKGLNLDASAKSLQGLQAASSRFSLAGISQGVQDLSSKFSALSIIGITALTNITNKAVNAGLQFAKSMTIAPIMEGFSEYELKMGSIQTILANTARHGTKLKDVSGALGELNEYADKTIYNFGDMTRNIGMFTNAGIKLEDSVAMIKGFSNEAAMSGTNAQQAAGAAYQLSQAMSKGKVTLEDWRSLTNASMGNKNMQMGLQDIAKAMGTFEKAGVSAEAVQKDFNGTLEKGWLTSDVMTNYLKIQAGEMTNAQMKSMGLTDAQIKNFQKMQKIAEESATKVRTFSQLIGTLREAVGSSWSETWELLVGDFDEATVLFTNVSNTLGKIIGDMGDARNKLIEGWDKLGGRKVLIEALSNAFKILMAVLKPIGDAFREIFPPTTAKDLMGMTVAFRNFIGGLRPGAKTLDSIKRIAKGVFAIFDIGIMIIKGIASVFVRLFGQVQKNTGGFLSFVASIADWVVGVRNALKSGKGIEKFFTFIADIVTNVGNALRDAARWFGDFFGNFKGLDTSGFTQAFENLKESLGSLKPTGDMITKVWDGLINVFKKGLEIGGQLAGKLGELFSGFGGGMADAAKGIDFSAVLGMLGTGLLASIAVMVKKFLGGGLIEQIKDAFFGGDDDGGSLLDSIKEVFGGMTDTLSQMQTTLKASTLILIAGAIALLTASVVALSKVDAAKLPAVLTAITVMFVQLSVAMAVLSKINMTTSLSKMIAIGGGMILLAVAIRILAGAVEKLGNLSWDQLFKGLIGVTALLVGLAVAAKIMGTQNGSMIRTGIGLMAVAVAVKLLADSVKYFSGMAWEEMARGLTGVGAVLTGLALFTRMAKVNKGAMAQAGGLILLGVAIKIMASAVSDFANMDIAKMQQGLGALGGVLTMLALFSRAVQPSGMVATAVAMTILGGAMKIMASALVDFGNIPWENLIRGGTGLAGTLLVIAGAMRLMPKNMLMTATSLVVVAAALKIIASAFKDMGGMSWDEIGRGFTVLAGSLVILAGAMYLMSGAVAGAAAMLIVAGALAILTPALVALGGMSWDEIGRGLTVLAAAFVIIGLAGLILTPVIPALIGLGIAISLLGVGAALAGVGMLAFAAGLTALAAAGAVGITVLVAGVTALLGLIPYGLTQIGLGLVAFARVIGDNVPVFVKLATELLMGVLQAFIIVAPGILQFLNDLLLKLLNMIANDIPKFLDVGMRIIVGFLNGIARMIGPIVTAGVNIIVNFLNGIARNIGRIVDAGANIIIQFLNGISRNIPRMIKAGFNMIITFVDSLANEIRNSQSRMDAAGGNLAGAIIDGMVNGVRNGINRVAEAAGAVAQSALDTVKSWLGIKSPSREFMKLGKFSTEGFVIGISSLASQVARASAGVGKTAMDGLKSSISGIAATVGSHLDIAPTIRPIIDLSAVKKGAQSINAMLKPPALAVESGYNYAVSAAVAQRSNQETNNRPPEEGGSEGGTNITFNQYNNSPKAISHIETYRNTKNQLSVAKGALTP